MKQGYLTYSYTCQDGHEETETLSRDEAIEAICKYRFRAEVAEATLRAHNEGREDRVLRVVLKIWGDAACYDTDEEVMKDVRKVLAAVDGRAE